MFNFVRIQRHHKPTLFVTRDRIRFMVGGLIVEESDGKTLVYADDIVAINYVEK